MHLTVYQQGEIFYFAFLFGIGLGLYYDFYRLLRYLGFKSKSAVIAQDIIFMTTAGVLCFLFAQVTVNGHLRAFVTFAHIFGAISYRYSFGMLSGFVFGIIAAVLRFVRKISEKFLNGAVRISNNLYGKIADIFSKIYDYFMKKSGAAKNFEIN